jgi:hypothetical protein
VSGGLIPLRELIDSHQHGLTIIAHALPSGLHTRHFVVLVSQQNSPDHGEGCQDGDGTAARKRRLPYPLPLLGEPYNNIHTITSM